jgi:nucleoside-diphosphate-sugar epimerase
VVITGAAGRVGVRLVDALAVQPAADAGRVRRIVALDRFAEPVETRRGDRMISWRRVDLHSDDLARLFEPGDVVVHLTGGTGEPDALAENEALTRRMLAVANEVAHLIVVSSAAVYGARFDNPLPLDEDDPLRPTSAFPYSEHKTRLEALATEWKAAQPDRVLTVLRPAPVYGPPGVSSWLGEAALPPLGDRIGQSLPAQQFLHIDDLVTAIVHVVDGSIDGVFNVAPDDWISGDEAPALLGAALGTLPLPEIVSDALSAAVHWARGTRNASGVKPYRRAPWVVSNQRLRATGWRPASSSAETFVSHHPPTWWSQLVSRRRQEVTLGVVGIAGTTVAGLISARIAVWLRRRR